MPDLPPLSLLAPPLLLVAALVLAARPGRRPPAVGWLPQGAALVALALVAAGLCQVLLSGPRQASVGFDLLMLTFSLDHVSASMTLLVGFIGWVVMRYARSYLDGEAREGRFHALMLSVLAGVLVLMQAGSLAVFVLAFMAIGARVAQTVAVLSRTRCGTACGNQVRACLACCGPDPAACLASDRRDLRHG